MLATSPFWTLLAGLSLSFWSDPLSRAQSEKVLVHAGIKGVAQRAVIDRHCTTEWAEKIASPWADFEHAGHAKLEAMSGHEVYKITHEQTELWRKAADPLKAKWSAQVKTAGFDPDAVYADLVAELKKRGALAE